MTADLTALKQAADRRDKAEDVWYYSYQSVLTTMLLGWTALLAKLKEETK